jgi:hypothetical protein
MVEQQSLGFDHVADRDGRKGVVPGVTTGPVSGRTGRAVARAEDVGADHEIGFRIEGAAGTEQLRPPTVDVG